MAIGAASAVAADGPAGLAPADNAQVAQAAHGAMIAALGPVVEIATTAVRAEDPAPVDSVVPADRRIAIGIASNVLRRSQSAKSCEWKFCPSR